MLFLQSNPSDAAAYLIFGILFLVAVIIIQVAVVRWIFRINKQVDNQRAMIWILLKIAGQQGVPKEELDKIIEVFEIT